MLARYGQYKTFSRGSDAGGESYTDHSKAPIDDETRYVEKFDVWASIGGLSRSQRRGVLAALMREGGPQPCKGITKGCKSSLVASFEL